MMTRHQEFNWIRLSGTVGQKLALRFETLQLLVTKLALVEKRPSIPVCKAH
jgi:hypothetical protein